MVVFAVRFRFPSSCTVHFEPRTWLSWNKSEWLQTLLTDGLTKGGSSLASFALFLRPSFLEFQFARPNYSSNQCVGNGMCLTDGPEFESRGGDPKYGECASASNYALNFKNRLLFASVKAMFSSINLSFSHFSIIFSLWFRGIDWPTPNTAVRMVMMMIGRSIDTRSINLLESIRGFFFLLFISFLVRLGSSSVLPGWIPAKRLPTASV